MIKKYIAFIIICLFQIISLDNCHSQAISNDFSKMDKTELRIERNSIYAKYGREFKSEDLKNYFNSKSWYKVNPDYSDSLINNKDRNTIYLIKCWENSNEILWNENIDLDGDSKLDNCYLLDNINNYLLYLIINNKSIQINNKCVIDYLEDSDEWFRVDYEIVNLSKQDKYKAILINQFTCDDYDGPPTKHLIISYYNKEIILSSVEGGSLYYSNENLIHTTGWCRDYTKSYYMIKNGKLKIIKKEEIHYSEEEYPEDSLNCAACFTSNSKILTNNNGYKLIKDLKVGDSVLTYDLKLKKQYITTISNLASVKHSNLVELYFKHDTIISTTDHPYFVNDKGWCSFKPNSTLMNYSNYNKVNKISNGDYFILNNGKKSKLLGHSYINQEKQTYTITGLENGNTFYVNGILVGVEELNKHTTNNVYSTLERTIH